MLEIGTKVKILREGKYKGKICKVLKIVPKESTEENVEVLLEKEGFVADTFREDELEEISD